MTMTFVSLVLIQFFHAYSCRSDRLSVVRRPFANRWLNLAIAWEMLMLGIIIYVPFFQRSFGTFSLTPGDWVLTTALAVSIVAVIEGVKWITRRGWLGEHNCHDGPHDRPDGSTDPGLSALATGQPIPGLPRPIAGSPFARSTPQITNRRLPDNPSIAQSSIVNARKRQGAPLYVCLKRFVHPRAVRE